MPCNYKRDYVPEWKQISKETIKRAGNKCQICYAPNGKTIYRYGKDCVYPWSYSSKQISELKELPRRFDDLDLMIGLEESTRVVEGKPTTIILTVHHIDGDKKNNSKHNLIALCQKDHLRLDMEKHVKNRKKK